MTNYEGPSQDERARFLTESKEFAKTSPLPNHFLPRLSHKQPVQACPGSNGQPKSVELHLADKPFISGLCKYDCGKYFEFDITKRVWVQK